MNIPIPTKIGSKMGGEFTYQPKWDPKTVLTTTAENPAIRFGRSQVRTKRRSTWDASPLCASWVASCSVAAFSASTSDTCGRSRSSRPVCPSLPLGKPKRNFNQGDGPNPRPRFVCCVGFMPMWPTGPEANRHRVRRKPGEFWRCPIYFTH